MSILAARTADAPPAAPPPRDRAVVAWNGTRSSRAALGWAAAREGRRGGALVLVRVLEDTGGFRPRGEVQRTFGQLDAEVRALRSAFPGLEVGAELGAGAAEEVLPAAASGPALLVVGTRPISGDAVRSPWTLGMRLLAGGRASVAVVPTDAWSWRSGVVTAWRGPDDGAAVLFAAEEAQARRMLLTLVARDSGPDAGEEADLVLAAFPGLELEVLRVAAPAPVLIGLARSAALVVVGAEGLGEPEPHVAAVAGASEAPVAVIRAPRLLRRAGASGRTAHSLF